MAIPVTVASAMLVEDLVTSRGTALRAPTVPEVEVVVVEEEEMMATMRSTTDNRLLYFDDHAHLSLHRFEVLTHYCGQNWM